MRSISSSRFTLHIGLCLVGMLLSGMTTAQDPKALASLLCEQNAERYSSVAELFSESRQKLDRKIRENQSRDHLTQKELTEILNKVLQGWFADHADDVYQKQQKARTELTKLNEEPPIIALMVSIQGLVLTDAAKIGLEQPGLSKLRYQRMLEESCKSDR